MKARIFAATALLLATFLMACSDDSAEPDASDRDASGQTDGTAGFDGSQQRDGGSTDAGNPGPTHVQWEPFVVSTFEANEDHRWDEFPLQVTFTHEDGDRVLTLDGYWIGGNSWAVRFAAPLPGRWTWSATSETGDDGLVGDGAFTVRSPTDDEISANRNYHGHIRTNGRYFEYADGTAFLPLGDTFWGMNSLDPLGALDGDFYTYIDDRVSKGFNTVLVMYLAEFNEGGYLWDAETEPPDTPNEDWSEINPSYFDPLDTRVQAFWDHGLVLFGHPTWLVEISDLTVEQAVNLSRYLLARYGAYNLVWSLTGEFHSACDEGTMFCDDDFAAVADLGRWVGGSDDTDPPRPGFNPFHHPMSVHPGGWDPGDPEPNMQTSRIFDGEDWLDHHWIQTYKETDKIVYRISELRGMIAGGLESHLPVLLAEPFYEHYPDGRYCDWDQGTGDEKAAATARRQAWTALYAGAAGYMYGAQGVWQGENVEALDYLGSGMIHHVKDLLLSLGWPSLEPDACVEVQRDGSWQAPELDYPSGGQEAVLEYTYSPRCLIRAGDVVTVYVPAGNEESAIRVVMLSGLEYQARWVDPRDGTVIEINDGNPVNTDHNDQYRLPERPSPSNDDWALVLEHH